MTASARTRTTQTAAHGRAAENNRLAATNNRLAATASVDFARTTLWFSRAAIAIAVIYGAILWAADVAFSPLVQYAPFVLSLVLLGLPHGAVDHLVPARLRGEPARCGTTAMVIAAYVALAAAYLVVWFALPPAAFAFFILLTWFHWGQGDLYALAKFSDAAYPHTRPQRALTIFVRGALPMLVPLVARPAEYRMAATEFVRLFGVDNLDDFAWAFAPEFRAAAAIGLAFVAACSLWLGYRRAGVIRVWRADAGETLLLVVYFTALPPALSIGWYFCCWHSARHIARLVRLAPQDATDERASGETRISTAFLRFMRDALPCTLAALALLGGLFFLLPQTTLQSSVALYLVLLSALTVPHTIIVAWMDLSEGVWRRSGD